MSNSKKAYEIITDRILAALERNLAVVSQRQKTTDYLVGRMAAEATL